MQGQVPRTGQIRGQAGEMSRLPGRGGDSPARRPGNLRTGREICPDSRCETAKAGTTEDSRCGTEKSGTTGNRGSSASAAGKQQTPAAAPRVRQHPAQEATKPASSSKGPAGSSPAVAGPASSSPVKDRAEDRWYVQTEEGEHYGPVPKEELDAWAAEGRLDASCQVLCEGWPQWKWAEDVYPELAEPAAQENPFAAIVVSDVPRAGRQCVRASSVVARADALGRHRRRTPGAKRR